jgi:hypothetical protein
MNDAAVREELVRVLASPGFANAQWLSRLLSYLVEETLAGRQDAIKEYTIGVEIYRRKPDYDPKIDAIVRVEASRLRAKLKQYYDGIGKDDPVRIDLPPGGYVLLLQNGCAVAPEVSAVVSAPSAGWRPVVLAVGLLAAVPGGYGGVPAGVRTG